MSEQNAVILIDAGPSDRRQLEVSLLEQPFDHGFALSPPRHPRNRTSAKAPRRRTAAMTSPAA